MELIFFIPSESLKNGLSCRYNDFLFLCILFSILNETLLGIKSYDKSAKSLISIME